MNESALISRVAWRLVPLLMVSYVASYLDRVNIGFAKLQMLDDLGASETVYGLGAGIFFLGYVLFGVPANLLLQRIGAKVWIGTIMVTWGVISGLMAFITLPSQFYLLRFLLGVAEAGFLPGVILFLSNWFPNAHRARKISLFQVALPVSGVVGGPLSGWILDHFNGPLGYHGWQWLFIIESVPAITLGVFTWLYLDSTLSEANWLSRSERDTLARMLDAERPATERHSLPAILRDARVWQLSALIFGLIVGIYAISLWTPTLLKEAGVATNTRIGWLSAIPSLVATVGMVLFARSSDFRQERRMHLSICAGLGALGFGICATDAQNLIIVVFGLSLATTGLMSALPILWSFVTSILSGRGGAIAIGLINSVGNIGGLVGPPIIGRIKDTTGTIQAGLGMAALFAVSATVLALLLPPPRSDCERRS